MNLIKISILCLFLSSCSWFTKDEIVVIPQQDLDTCIKPPSSSKIILEDVDFKVVVDEFGIVWVGVSSRDYEKLSKNMTKILQTLKQKNAVIKYYESCHKGNVEDATNN